MSQRNGQAVTMAAAAKAAREALAADLLAPTVVLGRIEERCRRGLTWLRLETPTGLDDTKAWRRLLLRLDELGFKARLETVMPTPGEDPELKRVELVIGWDRLTVGMAAPASLISSSDSATGEGD